MLALIKELREKTGAGISQCQEAVEKCGEDYLLAYGYLKYLGCAVMVKGMTHENWVMMMARKYKEDAKANT